jgi:topoisomerase-4 subunit B
MRLSQVNVDGDHSISEILSFYMGKNTPDRRDFIMDNLVVDAEML